MNIQQTLVIVKPDGIAKGLVGQILCYILSNGLSIIDNVRVHLNQEWTEKLYWGEEREVYFEEVVSWVSSAPVLFLKISGVDAINKIKWQIIGRYPSGIRGKYAENWIKNVAHASDSLESANYELSLSEVFFERKREMDKKLFKGKTIFALTGMSECGKSTVGKYLESNGIPRLKIVKFFEKVRDKLSPGEELYGFIEREEKRDPYFLWDTFINEILSEMNAREVNRVSIESLYGGGLGPYLKQKLGNHFRLIYVDISLEIRLQRQIQREGLSSFEEAKKMLLPRDKVKTDSGIPELKEISDEIIDNSETLNDLYKKIDDIIKSRR